MDNHPQMQGEQKPISVIERLLRHDRVIVAVAVTLLVAVAGADEERKLAGIGGGRRKSNRREG